MTNLPVLIERFARFAQAAILLALAAAVPLQSQTTPTSTVAGGFRIGDRVLIRVDGEKWPSDTFTVSAGPAVVLPEIGAVSLAGVQRTDLERHLTEQLSRFIRNPVVHARAFVGISVLGEVARPGFVQVPVDGLLAELLNSAGGPTHDAKVEKMEVRRNGSVFPKPDAVRAAVAKGATIAQVDLQTSDEVFIPRPSDMDRTLRIVTIALSIPMAIFALTRLGK